VTRQLCSPKLTNESGSAIRESLSDQPFQHAHRMLNQRIRLASRRSAAIRACLFARLKIAIAPSMIVAVQQKKDTA
jgi:hypothetical protein